MRKLVGVGVINSFNYDFSLKVLAHIEVCDDGRLSFAFLAETGVKI